jgi:hypothetical protein
VLRYSTQVDRLDRLGGERRRAGDLNAAERVYRRALAIAERRLASADRATARVRNNLAVLLKYTGHFDEAAVLYERYANAWWQRSAPITPRSRPYCTTSAASLTPRDDRPTAKRPHDRRYVSGQRHLEQRTRTPPLTALHLRPFSMPPAVTLGNLGAIDVGSEHHESR